jgi:hypothetical protein
VVHEACACACAQAGPQVRTNGAGREWSRRKTPVRRPRREGGLPTRYRSNRQSQMHIPSGAAHTVVRVIKVIFDTGTSFFAQYDFVMVTNPAMEF